MAHLRINDVVRTVCIAADDNSLFFAAADRKLHFIAVVPFMHGRQRRMNGDILFDGDMLHHVDYLLLFGVELRFIGIMLQLAGAAVVINGANRLYAFRSFFDNGYDFARSIIFFDQSDFCFDRFTRQCVRHEYGEIFISSHAFAALSHTGNLYIIFLS